MTRLRAHACEGPPLPFSSVAYESPEGTDGQVVTRHSGPGHCAQQPVSGRSRGPRLCGTFKIHTFRTVTQDRGSVPEVWGPCGERRGGRNGRGGGHRCRTQVQGTRGPRLGQQQRPRRGGQPRPVPSPSPLGWGRTPSWPLRTRSDDGSALHRATCCSGPPPLRCVRTVPGPPWGLPARGVQARRAKWGPEASGAGATSGPRGRVEGGLPVGRWPGE